MLKKYKNYIISGVLVVGMLVIGFTATNIFTKLKEPPKHEIEIDTTSEVIGVTPQETAARFVYAAGNMGNHEIEIDGTTLINNVALKGNRDRRVRSINKSMPAIVPGSPMYERGQAEYATRYTKGLDVPTFYNISADTIKVSDDQNKRMLSVISENGKSEYVAVDVLVSFESVKTTYVRPRDTTWDGNYTRIDNKLQVKDLLIELVEIDGHWLVYDIPNAENELNSRFSTWMGASSDVVNEENNVKVEQIMVDGFEPAPTE